MSWATRGAIIIGMPVAVLLSSLFFHLYYTPVYSDHFSSYPPGAEENHDAVMRYIAGFGTTLPLGLTVDETLHLQDVRTLILWLGIILIASVMMIIISLISQKREAGAMMLTAGSLSSLPPIILASLALNFDSLFTGFHRLLFRPGSWIFSQTDLLIYLYPKFFFAEMLTSIIGTALALAGIIVMTTGIVAVIKTRFYYNKVYISRFYR